MITGYDMLLLASQSFFFFLNEWRKLQSWAEQWSAAQGQDLLRLLSHALLHCSALSSAPTYLQPWEECCFVLPWWAALNSGGRWGKQQKDASGVFSIPDWIQGVFEKNIEINELAHLALSRSFYFQEQNHKSHFNSQAVVFEGPVTLFQSMLLLHILKHLWRGKK